MMQQGHVQTPEQPTSAAADEATRVRVLQARIRELGWTGLVVQGRPNVRYLSGFRGTTAWLVITAQRAHILTDGRYWERAQQEAPAFELVRVRRRYDDTLREVLAGLEGTVGFEAERITVAQYRRFLEPLSHIQWVPADEEMARLRMVKDDDELAAIRRAAVCTDKAMRQVPQWLRPGITERELAWELEKYMREHGAEDVAFPIMVAFGEHTASPHAETGDTRLQPEMAVCVDMGARVDGYCADLTRSFWYGTNPDPEYLRAWQAVREASVAALTVLEGGASGRLVDAVARDTLARYGYREAFLHSLGHGLGLEVHEPPRLSWQVDHVIPTRCVVTVEPGVYLTGRWGIRLEELVIVWDNGPEVVSQAPHWQVIPTS